MDKQLEKGTGELVINNEKKFRHALDNMLEGVQIHDYDWRYIYVNDALVKNSSYTREELMGYTLMEKYPGIEQTDLYKTLHRCLHGRMAEKLETEFVFPDGRIAYFELIINPIPEGISILSLDRTAQHAAKELAEANETRFRSLIENGTDMITLSTVKGEVLYASPSVTKIFGYSLEELQHVSAFDFIHADDLQIFLANRNAILEKCRKSCHSELRLLHKNGTWIWCEATLTNMLDEPGIHALVSNFRDITERKNAEQAKAENKKLIQTIYGASPDAVIVINSASEITKWDEKSEALFGWKESEVVNKNLADIIIPGRYRLRHHAGMAHYLETGKGTMLGKSVDISALKKNGEEFDVSLSISPTEIDGKTHFVGFIRDISDKKTAEKQKEFEQNNLTALINNTKDLMWSVDRNFKLITSNQAFTEMIRFMSGKTIERESDMFSLGFPAAQMDRYKQYYQRAFAGETFTEIEFTPEPVDFWSEISFHPILKGEDVIGTACHSRDITERKESEASLVQSEKRLKEAQEIAHLGSWNLDFTTQKSTWSEEACRIYGLPESEKYQTYTDWVSFIHPDDLAHVMKVTAEAQKTYSDTFLRHRIVLKDGRIKHIHSISRFEFDEHGNAIGLYGIAHDVTEQTRAEKEKEQMTKDLENAREEEQLAVTDAVIAGEEKARQEMGLELHDNINQLLATAQLYLGMFLQKNPGPDDFIQKTEEMIGSAIKEIRDMAHSTISPFIEDHSLPAALETLSLIMERSGAVKITRKFTDMEEIPMPEKLKLALYRIVQEQFQNIHKYAKAQNIYLEMHCEECSVLLSIRDDGVGFDTSRKATGIGMKNIKTRISLYQGEMKIISSPGKGCTLTVKCHYPCI